MRAALVCTFLCALFVASHAMTLEQAVSMSDQEFAAEINAVASQLQSTLQQYQQVMSINQAVMEGKIPHTDQLDAALAVAQSKFSALQNTVADAQEIIQHRQAAQQQPLSATFTQAMADYARVLDVEQQVVAGKIASTPKLLDAIATAKAKFQHLAAMTEVQPQAAHAQVQAQAHHAEAHHTEAHHTEAHHTEAQHVQVQHAQAQHTASHVQHTAHAQRSGAHAQVAHSSRSHYASARAPRQSRSARRVRRVAPQPTKPFNLDAWIQANLPKTTLNQPVNAVYSHWADLQVGNMPMAGNNREVALQMEYINALKRFGKISYTMPAPKFPTDVLKTKAIKLLPDLRSYDDPELAPLGEPVLGGGVKAVESAVVPAMLEESAAEQPQSADEQLVGAQAAYDAAIEAQGNKAINTVEAIMARPTVQVKHAKIALRPVADAHQPSFGRQTPTIALLEEEEAAPVAIDELEQLQAQSEVGMNVQGRASVEAVETILARSESK